MLYKNNKYNKCHVIKHIPERTCVSCGKKSLINDFLRFTVSEIGELHLDIKKASHGRGIYLCKMKKCILKFIKNKKNIYRYKIYDSDFINIILAVVDDKKL